MGDKYKLLGSNVSGEKLDRVTLEGTTSKPTRFLRVGGEPVELTEAEVSGLSARGARLEKVEKNTGPRREAKQPAAAPAGEAVPEGEATASESK